jgi:anti-sigma regulatory factor (Ser/Thr protein kinase)
MYYCCLEAVQNASKHAGAGAPISIRLYTEADELHLEARDDGSGFDVASVDGGMGVENTRARLGAGRRPRRFPSQPWRADCGRSASRRVVAGSADAQHGAEDFPQIAQQRLP